MEANFAWLSEFSARADKASAEEAEQFFRQISADLNAALLRPEARAGALFIAVQSAVKSVPPEFASQPRVDCLLCLAQFHYLIGQPLHGVEPAADGSQCARRVQDPSLLRKALTFQGILLADTGNLPGAIECYAEALDLAIELKDLRAEASVWNNLGAAFIYAGQFFDAIGCMELVLTIADMEFTAKEHRVYA